MGTNIHKVLGALMAAANVLTLHVTEAHLTEDDERNDRCWRDNNRAAKVRVLEQYCPSLGNWRSPPALVFKDKYPSWQRSLQRRHKRMMHRYNDISRKVDNNNISHRVRVIKQNETSKTSTEDLTAKVEVATNTPYASTRSIVTQTNPGFSTKSTQTSWAETEVDTQTDSLPFALHHRNIQSESPQPRTDTRQTKVAIISGTAAVTDKRSRKNVMATKQPDLTKTTALSGNTEGATNNTHQTTQKRSGVLVHNKIETKGISQTHLQPTVKLKDSLSQEVSCNVLCFQATRYVTPPFSFLKDLVNNSGKEEEENEQTTLKQRFTEIEDDVKMDTNHKRRGKNQTNLKQEGKGTEKETKGTVKMGTIFKRKEIEQPEVQGKGEIEVGSENEAVNMSTGSRRDVDFSKFMDIMLKISDKFK